MGNERELLMIPGPTMVSPRVLRVLAKPVLSHVSGEFVEGYAEALRLQKTLFGTEGTPFMLSGSGTLGMEAAIANLVEKGEKVLCIENGFFGEKWEEIIAGHGGVADRVRFEWGEALDLKRIEEKLSSDDYKAVTVEHVDTSTGIANRVDKVGGLVKNSDALLIVDSVCGVGGMPMKMDEWNIDYCLTGSQKAIAAPPGTSMFCLNDDAWGPLRRGRPPSTTITATSRDGGPSWRIRGATSPLRPRGTSSGCWRPSGSSTKRGSRPGGGATRSSPTPSRRGSRP